MGMRCRYVSLRSIDIMKQGTSKFFTEKILSRSGFSNLGLNFFLLREHIIPSSSTSSFLTEEKSFSYSCVDSSLTNPAIEEPQSSLDQEWVLHRREKQGEKKKSVQMGREEIKVSCFYKGGIIETA